MSISGREKQLLIVVVAIAMVLCAFFFGFRKLSDANESLDKEISKLQAQYASYKKMQANAKSYADDTILYNDEYDKALEEFDTGYSQKHSIMFIKELEDKTGAWLSQAGLTQTEMVHEFGQIKSTNPYTKSATAYPTDFVGYKTVLTLAYQASYDDFKDLVAYINNYKYKCTMDVVSMSYNADSEVVSGAMTVTQYAITGADREFSDENLSVGMFGTSNIFSSSVFFPGQVVDVANGDNIISDYDYYVSLQSASSDVDSVVVGMKNDSSGNATISKNENAMQDVKIRFFGEDGQYYVQYSIGDVQYPEISYDDGSAFVPGDMLSLLVLSSERLDNEDLSGANATVINDTDVTLYVKIANEDGGNPRFVLKEKKGDIVVYN